MKDWRPRRASAELRKRIFAPEAAVTPALKLERPHFDWAGVTRWLVPAMGCFVMVTASLSHPQFDGRLPQMVAFSEPGQSVSANAPSSSFGNNSVPVTTVEWTFGRSSSSNNDSFVRTETNTLIK
jgi:hypothetical protein